MTPSNLSVPIPSEADRPEGIDSIMSTVHAVKTPEVSLAIRGVLHHSSSSIDIIVQSVSASSAWLIGRVPSSSGGQPGLCRYAVSGDSRNQYAEENCPAWTLINVAPLYGTDRQLSTLGISTISTQYILANLDFKKASKRSQSARRKKRKLLQR